MRTHLIWVLFVVLGPELPAAAGADGRDAARLAAFAAHARASGTLSLTASYTGDATTCADHDTCGVSGTARAKLRVDSARPVRVADDVIVVPVTGSVATTVRDTVSGDVCHGRARVRTAGLSMKGDRRGVLVRVGVAPRGSGADDAFKTTCRAPSMAALGTDAAPSLRVRDVLKGISSFAVRVSARRGFSAVGGYSGHVTTRATMRLRRMRG